MSEDTKGKVDEGKGRVKQAAGDLTGDDELHREGKVDKAAGKTRQAVSDAGEKVGEGVSKVADASRAQSARTVPEPLSAPGAPARRPGPPRRARRAHGSQLGLGR